MSIYKSAVQKPVTTALIFLAVIVIGVFCYVQLPIDQFPEMDPPYITVMTTYPGASASEVESNVTKVMENSLNSVDHLKELTSKSKDNISSVTMEFEWGTDLEEVLNDVRTYVDIVKDNLPDGCSNPIVMRLSTSMMPVIQYAIMADESYPALDKMLDDEIIPQLNRVDGIGNLTVSGAPERYVYVYLDQQKLDAYGLTVETVGNMIAANNLNMSSGTVKLAKEQYQMEVRSEFASSDEINDIAVTTTADGRQVFVRDIAMVKDTIKELSLDEKADGRECARLMVTKQTGANTVQICKDVRKEVARIQKTLPSDVHFKMIYDSSENIQNSIDSLNESIMYALCKGDLSKMNGKIPFDAELEHDASAEKVVSNYITYLGEAIVDYVNIFRPDVVLLSGGVCNQGERLTKPLNAYIRQYCFGGEKAFIPEVRCATLGSHAGVIGAANLCG